MLGTAVGKSNIVRSRHNTGSISSLSSVEVSLGVVISNSVGVGVRLINIGWLNISSSMDNWGMVDNRSNMDRMSNWVCNKTVVSNWMGNKSVVGKRMGNKSMVGNWVGNKSMVGYWVGNKPMVGCAMGDNSTMSMDNLVGRHSRGGGG